MDKLKLYWRQLLSCAMFGVMLAFWVNWNLAIVIHSHGFALMLEYTATKRRAEIIGIIICNVFLAGVTAMFGVMYRDERNATLCRIKMEQN